MFYLTERYDPCVLVEAGLMQRTLSRRFPALVAIRQLLPVVGKRGEWHEVEENVSQVPPQTHYVGPMQICTRYATHTAPDSSALRDTHNSIEWFDRHRAGHYESVVLVTHL